MKTALIIPCYNEENRLDTQEFLDFSFANTNIDLWFVNDGSTDKTFDILQLLIKKNTNQLNLYSLKNNKGKAEAIRETIIKLTELNKYQYIGFIDADNFRNNMTDFSRGVKLPLTFTTFSSKVTHEVFICIA